MPRYSTTETQIVAAGQNVRFTSTDIPCNRGIVLHANGSGIITLRGANNGQKFSRYLVQAQGNMAVSTGGTAGPISVGLTVNGETVYSATATATPAAIGDFWPFNLSDTIEIPCGCCVSVGLQNVINSATPTATATPIDVSNAAIIITRVC